MMIFMILHGDPEGLSVLGGSLSESVAFRHAQAVAESRRYQWTDDEKRPGDRALWVADYEYYKGRMYGYVALTAVELLEK